MAIIWLDTATIMTPNAERPSFQFTLRQLMAVTTLTSIFLSLACWAYRRGLALSLVVTVCVLSLALLALGIRTYRKVVCALGAVGFAMSLLVLSEGVSVLLFIDMGVVAISLGTVVMAFPKALRNLVRRNCYRGDGSFSKRRADRETAHLLHFGCNLVVLPLLVLLLANLLVVAVHNTVMPLPMVLNAFSRFDADPDVWKAKLRGDIKEQYEQWYEKQGKPIADARLVAVDLWSTWPFVLLAVVTLGLICWRLTMYSFVKSFDELRERLLDRRFEYDLLDGGPGPSPEHVVARRGFSAWLDPGNHE
jgi:hypothetical protein